MEIEKEGRTYAVKEKPKAWAVVYRADVITIEYKISKDICPDEAALRAYIRREKIF